MAGNDVADLAFRREQRRRHHHLRGRDTQVYRRVDAGWRTLTFWGALAGDPASNIRSDELLRPGAELLACRQQTAGVRYDLHVWRGQVHDFPLAADISQEGRRAITYLGDFTNEVAVPREPISPAAPHAA
jgi:hypothetical protein